MDAELIHYRIAESQFYRFSAIYSGGYQRYTLKHVEVKTLQVA